MTRGEAGKKGYEKTREVMAAKRDQQRANAMARWEPKTCPSCGNHIPYEKRANKFCNQSCAASFNNVGVQHNKAKQDPTNPQKRCLSCGKAISQWRKYCSVQCQAEARFRQQLEIVNQTGDVRKATTHLRAFMLKTQAHQCVLCGNYEWQGKSIPLVVDHANGDPTDNRLTNLRLICPNCDAQLPTFAGRNKGRGRASRREIYKRLGYC